MPPSFSPTAIVATLGKAPGVRRLIHYSSVSVVSTITNVVAPAFLVGVLGTSSVEANAIATAIATVPSFELNRRLVWGARGGPLRAARVIPFAALSFAGLLLSSVSVHFASDATERATRFVRLVSTEGANLATYGVLWALQFLLCDRVLFRARRSISASEHLKPGAESALPSQHQAREVVALAPTGVLEDVNG